MKLNLFKTKRSKILAFTIVSSACLLKGYRSIRENDPVRTKNLIWDPLFFKLYPTLLATFVIPL